MQQKDRSHADEMAQLRKQLADEMARMKSSHESAMEAQRAKYEQEFNAVSMSLRKSQQIVVKLEGNVLSLETLLAKKTDVEN